MQGAMDCEHSVGHQGARCWPQSCILHWARSHDVLQWEGNFPAMSLMLPWTGHASLLLLLLLRTAAVDHRLDIENLEWESLAGQELLLLPIDNPVLYHLALHACTQSCTSWVCLHRH